MSSDEPYQQCAQDWHSRRRETGRESGSRFVARRPRHSCCGGGDPDRRKISLWTWYPDPSRRIVAIAKVPAAVAGIGMGATHDVRDLGDGYEAFVDRQFYSLLVKGIRRERWRDLES